MQAKEGMTLTKALLACGVAAAPLYVLIGVIQALTRAGFDPTRHPLSLMSNGDLGWIQIGNFILTGLLVVAGALGMRRALHPGRGGTWGPLLIGVYGVGLIGAGIFIADPMDGFPPGTPQGPPASPSMHGLLHFIAGGLGFFALIAACFVLARRFAVLRQPTWSAFSVATGVIFFAAFGGIASGSKQPWIIIAFTLAVVLAWAWISAIAAHLINDKQETE
jgi:hypothetical protein